MNQEMMMNEKKDMEGKGKMDMPEKEKPESNTEGIDSIISRLEEYIADPKLATSETLTELKDQLVDLKSYLDGEDTSEMSDERNDMNDEKGHGGLMITIGRLMKKEGK